MKQKIIVLAVIFALAVTPSLLGASVETNDNFTHAVMGELCAVSWCPHCPVASEKIYDLFNNHTNLKFYYVTLVLDKNPLAQKRSQWLMDAYIPMLYLDGGYKVVDNPENYEQEIMNVGARNVHDVSINVTASWVGDAKIEVQVHVKNNGNKLYIGHVRAYVTEKTSRWFDEKKLPFHYAFLDYAINTYVFVRGGKESVITATFDGNAQHGNYTFGDIKEGNIAIIASTSYWMPFIQNNPWEKPKPTHFIAQFVDDAAEVEI